MRSSSFTNLAALRFGFSLFAIDATQLAALGGGDCRSNATHILWRDDRDADPPANDERISSGTSVLPPAFVVGRRRSRATAAIRIPGCRAQSRSDAERECLGYLRDALLPFDYPFLETLGFGGDDRSDEPDGLGDGIVTTSIRLALDAKVLYPWTDDLPKDVFYDYVLNYANLNEARTNWRPLLVEALNFTDSCLWKSGRANLTSVVAWVNAHLWTRLGRAGAPIRFKSGQTPLIFDPMSTIAFGYASCTGTSILFSNALRAVGIPSRVAGTPAWYGNASQGNHNWVEVYDPRGRVWKFLEPSPALSHVDTLDADPCSRWFCEASRFQSTKVYAATSAKTVGEHFPLAWERDCKDVPAVDRSQYYADVCGKCDGDNLARGP